VRRRKRDRRHLWDRRGTTSMCCGSAPVQHVLSAADTSRARKRKKHRRPVASAGRLWRLSCRGSTSECGGPASVQHEVSVADTSCARGVRPSALRSRLGRGPSPCPDREPLIANPRSRTLDREPFPWPLCRPADHRPLARAWPLPAERAVARRAMNTTVMKTPVAHSIIVTARAHELRGAMSPKPTVVSETSE